MSLAEWRAKQKPWEGLQIKSARDGWNIASARAPAGSRSWWAWGKWGLIQGGCPLSETGRVWAQHAETREEALRLLKEELGLAY
jgi:hypothetical protein